MLLVACWRLPISSTVLCDTPAADGLLMTDSKGVMTMVNDRLCSLSGYSRQELLQANVNVCSLTHSPTHTLSLSLSLKTHKNTNTFPLSAIAQFWTDEMSLHPADIGSPRSERSAQ